MKAVQAGLSSGSQGEAVADLHAALALLGFSFHVSDQERTTQSYGDETAEAVRALQQDLEVDPVTRGAVDAATAAAVNGRLFEQGILFRVQGRVETAEHTPAAGALLRAFDQDNLTGSDMGSLSIEEDGHFELFYDPQFYAQPRPGVVLAKPVLDLVAVVTDPATGTVTMSDPVHEPERETSLNLGLDAPPSPAGDRLIRGRVSGHGAPLDGIDVRVFDRDLGDARQPLGDPAGARTRDGGRFELSYAVADFADQEADGTADLVFALSRDGAPLERFTVARHYDAVNGTAARDDEVTAEDLLLGIPARPVEDVRIEALDVSPAPGQSEYDRVWRALEPLVAGRPQADAPDQERERAVVARARGFNEATFRDVSFAARETGLDAALVEAFADAARLSMTTFDGAVPAAVCYGLARTRGVTDLLSLAPLGAEDLRTALTEAGAGVAPLMPPLSPEDRDRAVATILDSLAAQLPGSRVAEGAPTFGELVGSAVPDASDQATLWRTYGEHRGDAAGFWAALGQEPGFTGEGKVPEVQYTFQLALLTQSSPPLMAALRTRHPDVTSTAQLALALDTSEKWAELLATSHVPIPAGVPGTDEPDRAATYAATLAGAMQVLHPTAAVTNLVGRLPATHLNGVQPAVAKFFAGAVERPGFDLTTTRIDDLVAGSGDSLLEGVAPSERPAVVGQVKRIQRLFRVTTGPKTLEAILDAGFTSAASIARLPRQVFLDTLDSGLSEPEKLLIHDRALNVAEATLSTTVLLHDAFAGVVPSSIRSADGAPAAQEAAERQLPGYATLFGAQELCECSQCQSVHSASAYLVDLFQFLDAAGKNAAGLTPLDVLLGNAAKAVPGRRPDLAHIQLSCANTNTPMPYVDLVNEALESYLVFSSTLPAKTDAAGVPVVPAEIDPNESSPGITAEELAAHPEHVRDRAYDVLAGATYPVTLPFSQPVAGARLALQQMGTSRHELLSVLRRDPGEAAARGIDAEALGLVDESFTALTGQSFAGVADAHPPEAYYGFELPPAPVDTVWVGGALPAGAQQHVETDTWAFAPSATPPPSGVDVHVSAPAAGVHQHFFDSVPAAGARAVGAEQIFFVEVLLDPAALPEQLMIQWNDGSWEHRAYWGAPKIGVGAAGTASSRYLGALPKASEWVRLEVPARLVGMAGKSLSGMAFTLFGGSATWGAAGDRTPSWLEQVTHVPTLLSRTGVHYVELAELVRTRFVNPSVPQAADLAFFERIPMGYDTLVALAADGFAGLDAETTKSLADVDMPVADLAAWAGRNLPGVGSMLVLQAPGSSCDLTLTDLRHLDGSVPNAADLTRLQRFLRLWRVLSPPTDPSSVEPTRPSWSMADVDRALTTFGAADVTPELVHRLSATVALQEELTLAPQKLLALWGPLPTEGEDALYRTLFLNRATRAVDPVFAPVDGAYLPAAAARHLDDSVPALLAALRLRSADLDAIRAAARYGTPGTSLAGPAAPLTLATLSLVYRYATLARALSLPVADLVALLELTGEAPFSTLTAPDGPFADLDPARTLRFVRLVRRLQAHAVDPALLTYLFGTVAQAPPTLAPGPDAPAVVATLRDDLLRLAADTTPVDDPTGEETRTRLALRFDPAVVATLASLVEGSAEYTAPLATDPGPLPAGHVAYDPARRLLTATGWLTDGERDALLAAYPTAAEYVAAVHDLHAAPRALLASTLESVLGWTSAAADLRVPVLEAALPPDADALRAAKAARFTGFLAALLPHLRDTLARALVTDAVGEALGLDPAVAALLLAGAGGIVPLTAASAPGAPAMADFLALVGDGLLGTYFANPDLTGPGEPPVVDPVLRFRWEGRHGFGARWTGALLADRTGPTSLHLRAGGRVRLTVDGTVLIDHWTDTTPAEYTATLATEAGHLYDIGVEYSDVAAEALLELRWSLPGGAAVPVPQERLYSRPEAAGAFAWPTYVRLHKAAALIARFEVTAADLAVLLDPARPGPHLDDWPVDVDAADRRALFAAWLAWLDFADLRSAATADPAALPAVLRAATPADAATALATATGWDPALLDAAAGPGGFGFAAADYADLGRLGVLSDGMRLLTSLGVPVGEGFRWADPLADVKAARIAGDEMWQALKARYDEQTWAEVARPLSDSLREASRAALVAHLLAKTGLADSGELFGHFLIDVEMSPVTLTSRIKQAISSVQLFVQRCRLNLEFQVAPAAIDADRWAWMRNYRVWEANRKVFLYPENWIEPELRDDKTPFFSELESELLQSDLTGESAEVAAGNFLEKLGAVAQLRLCGEYEQYFPAGEEFERVLHVFGRSFSSPRVFWYRRRVTVSLAHEYWTAWERVTADIDADEVLPVIWNRRLYVFWKVITEKPVQGTPVPQLRLGWSHYRGGKWSPKQMTPADTVLSQISGDARLEVEANGDELTIGVSTPASLVGKETGYDAKGKPIAPQGPYTAINVRHGRITFRNFNGLVKVVDQAGKQVVYKMGMLAQATTSLAFRVLHEKAETIEVLQSSPDTLQLYATGFRPYSLNDPFFVQEGPRAYLVEPSYSTPFAYGSLKSPDTEQLYFPGISATDKGYQNAAAPDLAWLAGTTIARTASNAWLAGRAGLATREVLDTPDAVVGAGKGLSKDTIVFEAGLIGAGAAFADYGASFRFETLFHPYAGEFQRRLNHGGVPALLSLSSQQTPTLPTLKDFGATYHPTPVVERPHPLHGVDFASNGSYSQYNWELFFHMPLLIATRLSQNQRFEEALDWFHYIFDPTKGADAGSSPERFWQVRPLRIPVAQQVEDLLKGLRAGDAAVVAQWKDAQAHPFQPHRVARLRLVAYQKSVVMKYLDTLIAWGDQLFRQDTLESINSATQLYVLAAALLGRRPERVPPRGRPEPRTYAQLRPDLDLFGEAVVQFENDLPYASPPSVGGGGTTATSLLGIGSTGYFGIPRNERLLSYWDTVADRLFKIRHGMNLEGVVRALPLFEPPIDPALLVQAAAQGVDLSSVVADLSAPLPTYRFARMMGKALEVTADLRALGAQLLATLEKRDGEALAALRAGQETDLLKRVKDLRREQLSEVQAAAEALRKAREVTQTRHDFYANVAQRNGEELNQLTELAAAQDDQVQAHSAEATATDIVTYSPDISVGVVAGPVSGATFAATLGRANVVAYFQAKSREKGYNASLHSNSAYLSSTVGAWSRRADDWKLQRELAGKELVQIDQQIAAAQVRVAIAEKELANTEFQIDQTLEVQEFLRAKYTGEELYGWMQGALQTTYFSCWSIAYDLAKKAERCFRYELGLLNSNYIRAGSWDSARKGLLAGERLHLQLKELDRAYLDQDRRDYELTRHYSLVLQDPAAFVRLKAQGWCDVDIPESFFDADYPGHYLRRLKTVGVTVPAVVGPYSGVQCTLRLLRDTTRVSAVVGDGYAQRVGESDERFTTNWARPQAIATSTGQNDSGLFEPTFRDERYLPFEGAGAVSSWRIELDPRDNTFDAASFPDVLLHLHYTAREGGDRLKAAARGALAAAVGEEAARPQARLLSLKHEYGAEWYRLTRAAAASAETFVVGKERFPYVFRGKTLTAGDASLYAVLKPDAEPVALELTVTPPAGDPTVVKLEPRKSWNRMLAPQKALTTGSPISADSAKAGWTVATGPAGLPPGIEDLLLVVEYAVTG